MKFFSCTFAKGTMLFFFLFSIIFFSNYSEKMLEMISTLKEGEKIDKLINECNAENYVDSDSDLEFDNLE